jgi:hypothetical protein
MDSSQKSQAGDPVSPAALDAISKRLDEHDRALSDLRVEIREWLAAEMNRLADRLEMSGTKPIAAPIPPAADESAPEYQSSENSDFLSYARQVEEQLRGVEERVERAGKSVQDLSAGEGPAAPGPPKPDPAGAEAGDPAGHSSLGILNAISFEQLRDLGLSVTEAARLLARRDAHGSFASLDELDDLVGFSRDVLDRLKRRLSVG